MEYQIELNALPEDCIAEILKHVRKRSHRNDARLVCKYWNYLINMDSSCERFLIDRTNSGYDGWQRPFFNQFVPQFLISKRKKISFRFEELDFSNTQNFWAEKGAHIIGLNFEKGCSQIPIADVFSNCIRLKEMSIELGWDYRFNEFIEPLELLAMKEFYNDSLQFLTVMHISVITFESTKRLLQVISKVFPRMKKVTFNEFNLTDEQQLEELRTNFIDLKFELVINQCRDRTFDYDSSSNSPLSLRKVCTKNWQTLPHEYCENLEEITYTTETFPLSELENIIRRYPTLKALNISSEYMINDLKWPVENRLRRFNWTGQTFVLNQFFVDTFQFLRVFHIDHTYHATFVHIIRHMEHLEELKITHTSPGEINNNQGVLVHRKLEKLMLPFLFLLQTGTIYHFSNLTEITVRENGFLEEPERRMEDDDLRCFQCPNVEAIHCETKMKLHIIHDSFWLQNLMSLFPRVERYRYRLNPEERYKNPPITENELLELREICPNLRFYTLKHEPVYYVTLKLK